eukprot:COSAG01_NODE_2502_length_7556_cov_78.108220_9_plen_471_part_00
MQDIMGNVWSLQEGIPQVCRAQDGEKVAVPTPAPASLLSIDYNGMIWSSDGARALWRLNPRGPGYTDDGCAKRDAAGAGPTANVGAWGGEHTHDKWQVFPAASLPSPGSSIITLAPSTTSDRVVVGFVDGVQCEVELSCAGEVLVAPPAATTSAHGYQTTTTVTHPDGSSVSVVTESRELPEWRQLPGLLPCGNHDIFCCRVDRKLYISGGALWWRGYPALMHEFDDLWACDVGALDKVDAWQQVSTMPDSKCFNGISALGTKLYLPGGCKCGPFNDGDRDAGIPNIRVDQDSLFIYDTATDSWIVGPSMHHARNECVAQAVAGRVYAFGWTDVVESIAEGETTWRVEPARCPVVPGGGKAGQCSSAVLDEVIYIAGDFGLLAFTPAAGSWATIEGCPPTSAPLMTAHEGEIYVMSGYNPDHSQPLRGVHSYSPASCSWRTHPDLPTNNAWGAAASVGDTLLAIGGAVSR